MASVIIAAALAGSSLGIDVPEIVRQSKPAVVQIAVLDAQRNLSKRGTGFFVSPDGYLITNFHVISGATNILAQANTGAVFLLDRVVFQFPEQDLAVLKFIASDMPHIELGDSSTAVEGQRVLVIGNPEGLEGTVSDGIISAFRGDRSLIQITAPISPGSSGSPVLDESGRVIGIAAIIYKQGQNLNFAIPVETLKTAVLAESHLPPSNKQTQDTAPPLEPLATPPHQQPTSREDVAPRALAIEPRAAARRQEGPSLNEFVKEFVTSGNSANPKAEIWSYADEVDYFDNGKVKKAFIAEDINKYNRRWPERRYWIIAEPTLQIVDSVADVAQAVVKIGFAVQNTQRAISGTCQDVILIRDASTNPKVISVRSQFLSRHERAIDR